MTALAVATSAPYPENAFEKMLRRIAAGDSIVRASKRLRAAGEHAPSPSRFLRWCQKTPERWQRYLRAKVSSSEMHADKIHWIADSAGDGETDPAMFGAKIQKAKLQIYARQWTASKLDPHRFGDKLQHEHSGNLTVTVATGIPDYTTLPTARLESKGEGVLSYTLGEDADSSDDSIAAPPSKLADSWLD